MSKSATKPAADKPAYHRPRTVDELTEQNVRSVQRMESAANLHRSKVDRLADRVSGFGGSGHFLWIHAAWFGGWIFLNTLAPLHHFDPYPFTFLTLVVSLEAIFLSAFILISQNQAERVSERRNQLDLQINLLTEQENTKMLSLLQGIAEKLNVKIEGDPSLAVLEQAMRPDKLAEQIAKAALDEDGRSAPGA